MTLTQINKAGLDELALDHVFTIGASGSSAYTFQGEGLNGTVNNPTLYLTRGKTYRFENGSGGHPIRIQSTSGASGTAYNTGVTNNAGSGTVIVEVQHDAPDVLYYQCTSHAAMNGILYIIGALADGGVTTAKIADDAVTGDKIATNLDLPDNNKIRFGTGNDLQIYHNGSNSYVQDVGTGNLHLTSNGTAVSIDKGTSENMAVFNTDGAVELYYDNSKKFETTSTGATVTGTISAGGAILSGNQSIASDSAKLFFGASNDLEIYHNGTGSIIDNDTGNLLINTASGEVQINKSTSEYMARFIVDGAVELYYDNSKKFETTSAGVTISGSPTINGTTIANGHIRVRDHTGTEDGQIMLGAGNDLKIYHNGTNNYLDSSNGHVYLRVNSTENAIKCTQNGNVEISYDGTKKLETYTDGVKVTGVLRGTTSGFGIDFAETSNASGMTSEVLDDYEEGTWTPTYNFTGSTGTFSYDIQTGRYTKIGNRVFYSCVIRSTGHSGTATNNLRISTLPFAVLSDSPSGGTCFIISGGNFTTNYGVATQLNTNEQIEFYRQVQSSGNSFDPVDATDLTLSGLLIKVEGHYQTTG